MKKPAPTTTFRFRDYAQNIALRRIAYYEKTSINTLLRVAVDAFIEARTTKRSK